MWMKFIYRTQFENICQLFKCDKPNCATVYYKFVHVICYYLEKEIGGSTEWEKANRRQ